MTSDNPFVFELHSVDPFAARPEDRDPARRFRGRLVAPVTVWTAAGGFRGKAGLTVSSLVVAEGEPPAVVGLVGALTDFWEALQQSGRFVVHVLPATRRELAERFAGRFPGPPFEGLAVTDTPWGPALDAAGTRASCRLRATSEVGYFLLVQGEIEELTFDESPDPPLAHYRGHYLTGRRKDHDRPPPPSR
jgi:flavin reductase (DIM6/NTAB) family NADH-FMN oxidoreductase RutF